MPIRLPTVFRFIATSAAATMAIGLAGWLVKPGASAAQPAYSAEQIAAAIRARDTSFDPAHAPSLHVHTHVTPTGQSPILAELEKQGAIPPLKDRLPADPIVMTGKDGIGQYGGTWMRLGPSIDDDVIITYRLSGANLFRWSPLGYPIEPHIAKSAMPSPDERIWTVELRPGLKWSDGQPYTADDIMYWWEHEACDKAIYASPPAWMRIGGSVGKIEKIDDFHVRFVFEHPYPLFLEQLAAQTTPDITATPAHYLRQFHPTIGDKAVIERAMAEHRLSSRLSVYGYMKAIENPDCPRLWPWIYRKYSTSSPQVFVRNPYYYVVDPAGNQLPYVDRVQFETQDPTVMPMSLANGGATMQERNVRYSDYTELMSRRPLAGTRILHWKSAGDPYAINPQINRVIDPKDPSSKWKAQLLADKHFRQALSLAINRKAIIYAEFNNAVEPSQVEPGPESPYHSEKLAKAFIDYDPARAGAMLDTLGLTKRDAEGFRTFPDGSRMSFNLDYTPIYGSGPAQFVVDNWAAVGVRTQMRERSVSLFMIEKDACLNDFDVWSSESDIVPLLSPRYFVAANNQSYYAPSWGKWFSRGGFYNDPAAAIKGCTPVPKESPMYEAMTCYEQAVQTADPAARQKLFARITDIAAENIWAINICTATPSLVVVKDNFKNVPDNAINGWVFGTPSNAGIETYYFDKPHDSPGAVAETMDALLHPVNRPRASVDNTVWQTVLQITIGLAVVAGIGYLAVRYRYVGQRLLVIAPTMVVISLIVFTIIQLPPGDYLTQRLAVLEASGDTASQQSIDDLREMFHFDEPVWKKYCRWTGLTWFTTFKSADAGLLQGSLGRSMAGGQLVNSLVGERLLFTTLMSAGTILLTWVIAVPIGVYSAVRKYTFGDHVLTLLGFIGMCVPAFLLALVLMAVSGVSGLFSPEFSAQPEWTWAKIADLCKHLWIPIVVLGVGGTAGMIRVLRANLLDELRRPYVVTAAAKGVRPMRRLIKYPLRMAMNPFVSGIGGLLPALISGGAIVSIVLSLPTIGPLMLDALRNQDMYLAGSLLILLNVLSMLGTLMSDLLLVWLDPRIRYGGGSR